MIITREQGQGMAVEQYKRHHAVAIIYCTGFGKSKAALDCVKTHELDPKDTMWSGLIIVNNVNSREVTWPNEIDEWAPEYSLCIRRQITICRYENLKEYAGMHFNWIIADEIHNLNPDQDLHLQKIKYDGIIIMTALEPEDKDRKLAINRLCKGHKLIIKDDIAIKSGIVNDYRLRIWYVTLDPDEWQEYLRLCRKFMKAQASGSEEFIKMVAGERAEFIYNSETKYRAAAWLRDQIRESGKRFVIHTARINMANRLSDYRYHGKTTDTALRLFLNGNINEIAAVGLLSESITIDNLKSSLIEQLNSKQHNLVQKIGRNMRLDPDDLAIIHLLVAKDTVDENWTNKAIQVINPNRISRHNIDKSKIQHYI